MLADLMPKGAPTTSAERMRLKKLRDQGLAARFDGSCRECGAVLKPAAGGFKAFALGLCWRCYKASPEGKEERRQREAMRRAELTGDQPDQGPKPVAYFGAKPGGEIRRYGRLREAVGAAYVGRGKRSGWVYVVWSDGDVTAHVDMTCAGVSGGIGKTDYATTPPSDPEWFLAQVQSNHSLTGHLHNREAARMQQTYLADVRDCKPT